MSVLLHRKNTETV